MARPQGSNAQAVLYAKTARKEAGGSIRMQLADCQALAEREGLEVIAAYSEEGIGGCMQPCGPELAAALRHAEGLGAALIVQHSDRLTRRSGQLAELGRAAERAGVRLRSVEDDTTLRAPILALAAAMDEIDSAREARS